MQKLSWWGNFDSQNFLKTQREQTLIINISNIAHKLYLSRSSIHPWFDLKGLWRQKLKPLHYSFLDPWLRIWKNFSNWWSHFCKISIFVKFWEPVIGGSQRSHFLRAWGLLASHGVHKRLIGVNNGLIWDACGPHETLVDPNETLVDPMRCQRTPGSQKMRPLWTPQNRLSEFY